MAEDQTNVADATSAGVQTSGSSVAANAATEAPPIDWRASLGTDLAKEKVFDTIKAKDATEALPLIAQRFVAAEKMIGGSIQLPKKDAKPEDVAKWREAQFPKLVAAGLVQAPPKSASEYTLDPPKVEGIPEMSEPRAEYWKQAFHKLGITQAQAQGLLEAQVQEMSQGLRLIDEKNQDAIDQVRDKWGAVLFDRRWALANRAVPVLAEAVGLDVAEVNKYLDATRKGNDPVLFQLLAAVGEALDEDQFFTGQDLGIGTPEEAKRKIEAMRADPKGPFMNDNHPRHAEAMAEMEGLYKLAYGVGKGVSK